MNADTATAFITSNKGADIEIVLVDGDSVYGTAFSVNSKGVNVKDDDGKTRSVSLARVDELVLIDDDTFGSDDDADDEAAADLDNALNDVADSISDGATTAEVAAALSDVLEREITPKELRVHLRALGLGVGKGRKYALSAGELRAVHNLITEADKATATA
jgi:hypothetical protein